MVIEAILQAAVAGAIIGAVRGWFAWKNREGGKD